MPSTDWENGDTCEDPEEQRVLFAALDSFYQYAKVAHFNTTHLRRQSFYALPRSHWELLAAPPFSYLDTLNSIDDAIDKNAELSLAILQSGLDSFDLISPLLNSKDDLPSTSWLGKSSPNDMEKARSTLRQFYRDWSEEGFAEREACYGPVIRALQAEQVSRGDTKMKVLVPGAGLARLVFDLCCAGFDTEGNEISYHQLIASSYILNHCSASKMHTLYPWVHSFSNHLTRENQLQSVLIPDIHPGTTINSNENVGQMTMSASDFLLLYGSEDQKDTFDAVSTVFFLDTAPNIIRYIEVIKNCLRQGGLLVNLGPLLWHFENNAPGSHGREKGSVTDSDAQGIADPGAVELTDDEVQALFEKFGFTIEHRESNISAPYIQDPRSMLQNTYKATHWVARKQ